MCWSCGDCENGLCKPCNTNQNRAITHVKRTGHNKIAPPPRPHTPPRMTIPPPLDRCPTFNWGARQEEYYLPLRECMDVGEVKGGGRGGDVLIYPIRYSDHKMLTMYNGTGAYPHTHPQACRPPQFLTMVGMGRGESARPKWGFRYFDPMRPNM